MQPGSGGSPAELCDRVVVGGIDTARLSSDFNSQEKRGSLLPEAKFQPGRAGVGAMLSRPSFQ